MKPAETIRRLRKYHGSTQAARASRSCMDSIDSMDGSLKKKEQVMNLRSAVSSGSRLGLVFLFVLLLNGNFAELAAQSFRGGIRREVTDAHGLLVDRAK